MPIKEIYEKAHELKVIVYNKDYFYFAERQTSKVIDNCILFLQPEWSKRDKVFSEIVDYVLQTQSGKFLYKHINI